MHKLLGNELVIGYDYADSPLPVTVPNPYKSENIQVKGQVYTVEYYLAVVRQPDGVVSNDELVPLVFHNRVVAGRGWKFLDQLK